MSRMEREWKFLVERGPSLRGRRSQHLEQGYLDDDGCRLSIRVRIADRRGWLTIKARTRRRRMGGPKVRREFEYEIPLRDARALLGFTSHKLVKRRYEIGRMEVDVFHGDLEGLVLAEVPVARGRRSEPDAPRGWRWKDVSHDRRYGNSRLARKGRPADAPRAKLRSARPRAASGR
jgi:adenylate cyclase